MRYVDLSVIVPVYNVQDFLYECLNSIVSQSVQPKEIILIDDGSTDDSGRLCDDYSKAHQNVVVVHQLNKGLSVARNNGIKLAKSRYVTFIDSDDFYIDNDLFKKVFIILSKQNYDCVCYRRCNTDEQGNILSIKKKDENNLEDLNENIDIACKKGLLEASAPLKFLDRTFIVNNLLFFKPGILSEDVEWFLRCLPKFNRICFSEIVGYGYRKRFNSISHTVSEKHIKNLFDTISFSYETNLTNKSCCDYTSLQLYILLGYLGLKKFKGVKQFYLEKLNKYKSRLTHPISKKTKLCHFLMICCFGNLNLLSSLLAFRVRKRSQ